jgi:alginate O-acetyltransferase complex protein AlgI
MMYIYSPVALWITRQRVARGLDISKRAMGTPGGFVSLVLLPIVVTMVLAGLWHGAGAQFVVFGLLHAAYLSVNHAWRVFRPRRPRGALHVPASHARPVVITYLCVIVGQVVFRAPSVPDTGQMLLSMLGAHGGGGEFPLPGGVIQQMGAIGEGLRTHGLFHMARWQDTWHALQSIGALALLYVIVWALPNTQQILIATAPALDAIKPGKPIFLCWQNSLPWAIAFGGATTLGLLSVGGTGEFLYFQF